MKRIEREIRKLEETIEELNKTFNFVL